MYVLEPTGGQIYRFGPGAGGDTDDDGERPLHYKRDT